LNVPPAATHVPNDAILVAMKPRTPCAIAWTMPSVSLRSINSTSGTHGKCCRSQTIWSKVAGFLSDEPPTLNTINCKSSTDPDTLIKSAPLLVV
jgi:hypothetical protein